MGASDYNVADRNLGNGIEAAEVLSESSRGENPDVDAKERAETAGVSHPAYIDYAAALATHEARADIEPLSARRAREYGDDFTDADFMRNTAYDANGDATAPPRPGTVHGDAPKDA